MRESIRQIVKIFADTFPVEEPIYEFGALQLPGFEDFADLRSFFTGKSYVGCDMREGRGVDKVLNLHEIAIPDETVGTAITCDTLEHVEFPHKALLEFIAYSSRGVWFFSAQFSISESMIRLQITGVSHQMG